MEYGRLDGLMKLLSTLQQLSETGYRCNDEIAGCIDAIWQELKSENTDVDLSKVSTKDLHEALVFREGITEHIVNPHVKVGIDFSDGRDFSRFDIVGPVRILVNTD